MTPDQRLRLSYPYVADLPERAGGWGHDYDRVHEWLCSRFGGPLSGRWYLLGLLPTSPPKRTVRLSVKRLARSKSNPADANADGAGTQLAGCG
jgi:hypothetical protein